MLKVWPSALTSRSEQVTHRHSLLQCSSFISRVRTYTDRQTFSIHSLYPALQFLGQSQSYTHLPSLCSTFISGVRISYTLLSYTLSLRSASGSRSAQVTYTHTLTCLHNIQVSSQGAERTQTPRLENAVLRSPDTHCQQLRQTRDSHPPGAPAYTCAPRLSLSLIARRGKLALDKACTRLPFH